MNKIVESDFTVVGGGIAGICAAVAAARHGIKVALVNDRDVAGGNASSENRVHLNGGATGNSSYYSREAGIADEIKLSILNANPIYNKKQDYHLSDMAILNLILNEPNISYFSGTAVYSCETENNKITKAYGFKSRTGEIIEFISPCFCDASGDGILGYTAGADFRVGREAHSEFGENLAPENADEHVMGSCILFTVRHTGKSTVFKKPEFAYDFVKDGIIKYFDRPNLARRLPNNGGPYDMWWIEYGGMLNTILDADAIDFELKKIVYSYWDYIKNSGNYPETDDCVIDWIAPAASKRESRRFMAPHIMCESDVLNTVDFPDKVATGGWSLDIHDVEGLYGNNMPSAFGEVKSMYSIPLSIMYSRNIENLFLGGRIVSCTHVALGTLRLMETLGAMGHAVGVAASLCKKYSVLPDTVDKLYISEVQSLLQYDGQYIMGLRENLGFAENAKVTSSSVKKFENTREDRFIDFESDAIYTLPTVDGKSDGISVRINNTGAATEICYTVYAEEDVKTYRLGEEILSGTVSVDANFDGYLNLPFNIENALHKVFVKLQKNENIKLCVSDKRVVGAPSFIGKRAFYGGQKRLDGEATYCFKTSGLYDNLYAPENVINGFSRPTGSPNAWVSASKINEKLTLCLAKKSDIKEVQIYFNPQFETEHFNDPISQLVNDYKVTLYTENGKKEVEVKDNYLARSVIHVDVKNVYKIEFEFISNGGADEFEVFSVKLF